jgi:hypothetical protein
VDEKEKNVPPPPSSSSPASQEKEGSEIVQKKRLTRDEMIKEQARKLQQENVKVISDGDNKAKIIPLPAGVADTNQGLLRVPMSCKACVQGEPNPDLLLVLEGKLEVTSLASRQRSGKNRTAKSSAEFYPDLGIPWTVLNENEFYTSLKNSTITSVASASPFATEEQISISTSVHTFSGYTGVSVHPRTRVLFVGLGTVLSLARSYGIKM